MPEGTNASVIGSPQEGSFDLPPANSGRSALAQNCRSEMRLILDVEAGCAVARKQTSLMTELEVTIRSEAVIADVYVTRTCPPSCVMADVWPLPQIR